MSMTKRGLWIVALACAAVLATTAAAAPPVGPVPTSMTKYLLGAKMIRGEVVVKRTGGEHDYRLDRGKLVKRYSTGLLTLLERDKTKPTVPVASTARVVLNGKPSTLRRLRAGMQIAVWHDGDQPANTVLASTRAAPKWPTPFSAMLFGPRLIRAEIPLQDTALHDYRLDHGRIRQIGASTLTLREPDGTDQTIDVSLTARVKINGQNGTFFQLRRGMMAVTMRDGDKPADQVYAIGR